MTFGACLKISISPLTKNSYKADFQHFPLELWESDSIGQRRQNAKEKSETIFLRQIALIHFHACYAATQSEYCLLLRGVFTVYK